MHASLIVLHTTHVLSTSMMLHSADSWDICIVIMLCEVCKLSVQKIRHKEFRKGHTLYTGISTCQDREELGLPPNNPEDPPDASP